MCGTQINLRNNLYCLYRSKTSLSSLSSLSCPCCIYLESEERVSVELQCFLFQTWNIHKTGSLLTVWLQPEKESSLGNFDKKFVGTETLSIKIRQWQSDHLKMITDSFLWKIYIQMLQRSECYFSMLEILWDLNVAITKRKMRNPADFWCHYARTLYFL